jgi:hypothetical protein
VAAAVVLLIIVCANVSAARWAAKVDPIVALREE